MNLYLIVADQYGYDDYDKILVRAESESSALALVTTNDSYEDARFGKHQKLSVSVVEVEGPNEVVIASFNAG
jgi:hypothetical protein